MNDGVLEYWSSGWQKRKNISLFLQAHHTSTPLFQYPNWGEAPKFTVYEFPVLRGVAALYKIERLYILFHKKSQLQSKKLATPGKKL